MTARIAQADERYGMVDALRGFALFGLFVVHSTELFELYWLHPEPGPVHDGVFFLFAGKSFALFALCFGLSFHIVMERARARGYDYSARFAWRLAILLALGLVHGLIYRGEILQILALLGFTLIVFDRIRSSALLLTIAGLLLVQPFLILRVVAALSGAEWALAEPGYWNDPAMAVLGGGSLEEVVAANAYQGWRVKWAYYIDTGRLGQIAGLFLLGLVLGRARFFYAPDRFTRARRGVLALALLLALAFWFIRPALLDAIPAGEAQAMTRPWLDALLSGYANLAILAVQVALFVELYQSVARPVLRLFEAPGRMTLTLYVGQSLVFVPVFYGFGLGLHATIGQTEALTLGLAAFALQALFARLWFGHFCYGPLEWAWRAATWTSLKVPLRRAGA